MIINSDKRIIIFDGICNLCNNLVQFVIKHDKKDMFRFVPLQSGKAKQIISCFDEIIKNSDSVILFHNNRFFIKSDAALEIANILNYPWKVFYFFRFIPKFIRDWIYEFIAQNRYQWFGKKTVCMVPTEEIKPKFLDD